jgi:hypothetical protein
MPASNPGRTGTGNAGTANGVAVTCSPFSGPAGSPFDNDQPGNHSTGALSTGLGFAIGTLNHISPTAPASVRAAGFTVGAVPGVSLPGGTSAPDARLLALGGGRSNVDGTANPYAAQPLLGFGNGGSRDAGAGPVFTGYSMSMVTATANVNPGDPIGATTFKNRVQPGFVLPAQNSAFGSANDASPPVT